MKEIIACKRITKNIFNTANFTKFGKNKVDDVLCIYIYKDRSASLELEKLLPTEKFQYAIANAS